MAARIHHPSANEAERDIGMSLCGIPGSSTSGNPTMVTCRLCARHVERAEKAARAKVAATGLAPAAAAIRAALAQPVVPPTRWGAGLPALSPETYARRECHCGDCEVCDLFHDLELGGIYAEKRHGLMSEHRWTSVTAALEAYAVLRADGYSAGKSVQAAFEELAKVGAWIQGGTTDPTRRAHHEAAEIAVIERTLQAVYAQDTVGWYRATSILLLRVVGLEHTIAGKYRQLTERHIIGEDEVAAKAGIDALDVRSIVRRGRRALTVELAAREWIPPPREGERAYGAFIARADELEETRVA